MYMKVPTEWITSENILYSSFYRCYSMWRLKGYCFLYSLAIVEDPCFPGQLCEWLCTSTQTLTDTIKVRFCLYSKYNKKIMFSDKEYLSVQSLQHVFKSGQLSSIDDNQTQNLERQMHILGKCTVGLLSQISFRPSNTVFLKSMINPFGKHWKCSYFFHLKDLFWNFFLIFCKGRKVS